MLHGWLLKYFFEVSLVLIKVPFRHKYILEVRLSWQYCVSKGNIFFVVLLSLFSRDLCLSLKLTTKRCFSECIWVSSVL